jgi:hypothetical protein
MPVSDPLAEAVALSTDNVVCLRPLDVTGYELMRGEVVSTEGWPKHRIDILIERRYLAPVPAHMQIPAKTRVDGVDRAIIDLAKLANSAPAKPATRPTPTQATRKATPQRTTKKASE